MYIVETYDHQRKEWQCAEKDIPWRAAAIDQAELICAEAIVNSAEMQLAIRHTDGDGDSYDYWRDVIGRYSELVPKNSEGTPYSMIYRIRDDRNAEGLPLPERVRIEELVKYLSEDSTRLTIPTTSGIARTLAALAQAAAVYDANKLDASPLMTAMKFYSGLMAIEWTMVPEMVASKESIAIYWQWPDKLPIAGDYGAIIGHDDITLLRTRDGKTETSTAEYDDGEAITIFYRTGNF